MQKMNKEELIEYFMEILGEHHVLEKVLSNDEIRKRLNENLEEVTYEEIEGDITGQYSWYEKTIVIDLNQIDSVSTFKQTIIHELLHALSYSLYQDNNFRTLKLGFGIYQENKEGTFYNDEQWYIQDRSIREWGESINEGLTELLTEEILGIDTERNIGYEVEKDVTRVILGIIRERKHVKSLFF